MNDYTRVTVGMDNYRVAGAGMNVKQPPADVRAPINRELGELTTSITALEKVCDAMIERLYMVLRPEPPAHACEPTRDTTGTCELAGVLMQQSGRVDDVRRRLSVLLERVEL